MDAHSCPLSAFRAASLAALNVYQHILADGTQQKVIDTMQTRIELYDFLDYHQYERTLDQLFSVEQHEQSRSTGRKPSAI